MAQALLCKNDADQCPAMPMIEAKLNAVLANQDKMQGQLDKIENRQNHVIDTQKKQGTELLAMKDVAGRATETALEAKRVADVAQYEVSQMGSAIQLHVSGVEQTLRGHATQLFDVKTTLGKQDDVLANQSTVLDKIHDSEIARTARDELIEKHSEKQSKFIMWAVPLGFTLMTTVVGVTVWLMTHLRP
jgi:hypothetical protein